MCDEYDDETVVAFWRALAEIERRKRSAPEDEVIAEPLVKLEPVAPAVPKNRPRTLMR